MFLCACLRGVFWVLRRFCALRVRALIIALGRCVDVDVDVQWAWHCGSGSGQFCIIPVSTIVGCIVGCIGGQIGCAERVWACQQYCGWPEHNSLAYSMCVLHVHIIITNGLLAITDVTIYYCDVGILLSQYIQYTQYRNRRFDVAISRQNTQDKVV